jgi:hypothetical protein
LNGIVEIRGLDEKVAAELLFRFGEGTIGGRGLSVPYPNHGRRLSGLQWVAPEQVPALPDVIFERVLPCSTDR